MGRLAPSLMGLALLLVVNDSLAESGNDAETLFRNARVAMKAGRFDEACPMLRESQRQDPSPGTLLNLAICERNIGRAATALRLFGELLQTSANDAKRSIIAKRYVAELEPTVPRVHVHVKGQSGAVVVHLKSEGHVATLRLEGTQLQGASFDGVLLVDPGEHVLEAYQRGSLVHREIVRVSLGERAKRLLELNQSGKRESLGSADTVAHPRRSEAWKETRASRRATQKPSSSGDASRKGISESHRVAAYVAGGIGLAGAAASVVFTTIAMSKKDIVRSHCPERRCDEVGLDAAESGARDLAIANVGFAVAAAGLTTAGFLFLWRPDSAAGPTRQEAYVQIGGELP